MKSGTARESREEMSNAKRSVNLRDQPKAISEKGNISSDEHIKYGEKVAEFSALPIG